MVASFVGMPGERCLPVLKTYEHKFVVIDFLHAVADYPADSFSILYEIEFELFMLMKRVGKLRLVTLDDMQTVPLGKLCDFCENLAHDCNFL